MKNSNEGFTLVELMIVGTIMAVIVSISFMAYQQGVKRQYGLSQQSRTIANALMLARMQALENKMAIKVTGARSIDLVGKWYTKVQLTAANHGVKRDDYVAISGLTLLDTSTGSTETPSTGAYYVSGVTGGTFDCVYYHSDSVKETTGTVARNLTRAAQLIIQKKSFVKTLSQAEQKARYESGQFFIYDDNNYLVWDLADQLAGVDTNATDYSPVVGFTTRGFSASEAGYQLRLTNIPLKPDDFKIISVNAFGQVLLGITR
ncbi:MAG: prepilin-type N-terminal cleavage/methylation domain-containing protein [Desulfomonile tiedjei]|uniref:Prepilin-type N-terminal cleavage/methylation domain-containing protein n=1 Tax=Desulfomonile tiedjei TaxID=2358 RepID=A0A9D6V3V2_9BACT|nr:prepilin-type N-terminal cleavage/methylation domain-containing protein [Desulfomonile tiedjei]